MAALAIASSLLARLLPPLAAKGSATAADAAVPLGGREASAPVSLEALFSRLLAEACDNGEGNAGDCDATQPTGNREAASTILTLPLLAEAIRAVPAAQPGQTKSPASGTSASGSARRRINLPAESDGTLPSAIPVLPVIPGVAAPVQPDQIPKSALPPGAPVPAEASVPLGTDEVHPVQPTVGQPIGPAKAHSPIKHRVPDRRSVPVEANDVPLASATPANPLPQIAELERMPQAVALGQDDPVPPRYPAVGKKAPERTQVHTRERGNPPETDQDGQTTAPMDVIVDVPFKPGPPEPTLPMSQPSVVPVHPSAPPPEMPRPEAAQPTTPPSPVSLPETKAAPHSSVVHQSTRAAATLPLRRAQSAREMSHTPRPIRWTPPAVQLEPAEPDQPANTEEPPTVGTAADTRAVSPAALEHAQIAFIADLTPITPSDQAQPAQKVQQPALPSHATPPIERVDESAAGTHEGERDSSHRQKSDPAPPSAHSSQAHVEQPAGDVQRTLPHFQPTATPHAEGPPQAVRRAADVPEPPQPARVEPAPEPARQSTPAREIRLELAGTESRVEVKLSDRGGEVRVAVRTPDGPLAERLRENLPALSSRLSESGFRTEAWHPPSSAATDLHQTPEPRETRFGNESNPQPGHEGREQQQRDEQPRRPRIPEENDAPKKKGKDFEWLMSTIR